MDIENLAEHLRIEVLCSKIYLSLLLKMKKLRQHYKKHKSLEDMLRDLLLVQKKVILMLIEAFLQLYKIKRLQKN